MTYARAFGAQVQLTGLRAEDDGSHFGRLLGLGCGGMGGFGVQRGLVGGVAGVRCISFGPSGGAVGCCRVLGGLLAAGDGAAWAA